MKKSLSLLSFITIISLFIISCENNLIEENSLESFQNKNEIKKSKECSTIQSGLILYSSQHYLAGESISAGFDMFGYNYQAHIYKGLYANLYLGDVGYPPYNGDDSYFDDKPELTQEGSWFMTYYWYNRKDVVNMTWNDMWLSNKDCDGDGSIDTNQNTIGSGAWENFHLKGSYEDENGKICKWEQLTKIVAIPTDSTLMDGYWYDTDENEIGIDFYGSWAITQNVLNNPCGGENGVQYLSPFRAGFGNR